MFAAPATPQMLALDEQYRLREKLTPSNSVKSSILSGFSSIKTAILEAEAAHREFSAKLVREAHRCARIQFRLVQFSLV